MTTEQALLQAIIAQPDEDTPRLVYADHLDELGGEVNQTRAEFIRVQIQRVSLPANASEQDRLKRREEELWAVHRRKWRSMIPDVVGVNWRRYERGFLSVIDVEDVRLLVQHARELFRATPIGSVRLLRVAAGDGHELAVLPEVSRLRELDLRGCRNFTDVDVGNLVGSPVVANLRVLRLAGNRVGEAGVRALIASRYLVNVRQLEVGWPNLRLGRSGIASGVMRELQMAFPLAEVH